MSDNAPVDLVAVIRGEIDLAADAILAAAENGLRQIQSVRAGQSEALQSVEHTFCAVIEACAFQDLVGQRLTQLNRLLANEPAAPADPLLNGPSRPGDGLNQDAADILLRANP